MSVLNLSFSQVNMLLRCPKQYEYRYVKGLKIPPTGALVQGHSYHEALATNFTYKIRTKTDMSIKEVLDAFDTSWETQLRRHYIPEEGEFDKVKWERDSGAMKDEAAHMLQVYHKEVAPRVTPVLVERELEVPIASELRYRGIIDLIDTDDCVVDHKLTSRRIAQVIADNDIQVTGYHFLQGTKGDKLNSAFHNAVKTTKQIHIINTIRTRWDVGWWINLVLEVSKQIKSGIFPPNPTGLLCSEQYCGYYKLCRGK